MKVDPLNLETQNQAKNIPVVLPSSPIKIWDKSAKGFPSYDRTNKQTPRQKSKKMTEINQKYFQYFYNFRSKAYI